MKNTSIALILLTLVVLPGFVQAAVAQPIEATVLNYQPLPGQPGDLLTVYVQVENRGNVLVEDAAVRVKNNAAFTVEGQETVQIGTLAAQSVYVATFQVRVSRDIPTGSNLLILETKQRGTDWQQTTGNQLASIIMISTDEAAIYINDVRTMPESVHPGEELELTLRMENAVDTLLRDVSAELDLDESPFIPIEGTSRKKISNLRAGNSADVTFRLQADPTSGADIFKIPVTISFLNDQGTIVTTEELIGLRINTDQSTRAYVDDVERTNGKSQVSVRLVNKGLSEIKFVEVNFEEQAGYHIAAQEKNVYVGNIDSDDWETIRFDVETMESEITIPMKYVFEDAFNQQHTVTQNLLVEIPEPTKSNSGLTWTVLILLAIVVVIVVMVRRKKKK